jgi:hypothetical protein
MFRNRKNNQTLPSLEVEQADASPTMHPKSPITRIGEFLASTSPAKAVSLLSPIRKARTKKEIKASPEDSPFFPLNKGSGREAVPITAVTAPEPMKESPTTKKNLEPLPLATLPPLVRVPSLVAPEAMLMHKGNKLFWRINRTIDFSIYM